MDNTRGVVMHFKPQGYYSNGGDEVRWNRKDGHISTLREDMRRLLILVWLIK